MWLPQENFTPTSTVTDILQREMSLRRIGHINKQNTLQVPRKHITLTRRELFSYKIQPTSTPSSPLCRSTTHKLCKNVHGFWHVSWLENSMADLALRTLQMRPTAVVLNAFCTATLSRDPISSIGLYYCYDQVHSERCNLRQSMPIAQIWLDAPVNFKLSICVLPSWIDCVFSSSALSICRTKIYSYRLILVLGLGNLTVDQRRNLLVL